MRYLLLVLSAWFLMQSAAAQNSAYDQQVGSYIRKFSPVAIEEMRQYRIPASITLAQAIIESGAGQSRLAKEANNHFGIKCHKEWTGKTFHQDDDRANECFRKYNQPEESFRDHSYFLTQRDRYKSLFSLAVTDYRGWAEGLEKAGYATNRQYAEMLIRMIENYQLDLYDKQDLLSESSVPPGDPDLRHYDWIASFKITGRAADGRRIYVNNSLKCVVARDGDQLSQLSAVLGMPVRSLVKYNDLGPSQALEPGQVVYLEKKKRKAFVKSHIVQKGETLYEISQRYGLRMKLLLKRNGMSAGMDPFPGQVLTLR